MAPEESLRETHRRMLAAIAELDVYYKKQEPDAEIFRQLYIRLQAATLAYFHNLTIVLHEKYPASWQDDEKMSA